jgi:hypothetical protein
LTSDWSDEENVKMWLDADKVEEEREIAILPQVDSSGYPRIQARRGFEYIRSRAYRYFRIHRRST